MEVGTSSLGLRGHFMRSVQSMDVNTNFFECSIIVKSGLGHVVSGLSNHDFPTLSTVWTTICLNYTLPSKRKKVQEIQKM